jgi:hypothetical protein
MILGIRETRLLMSEASRASIAPNRLLKVVVSAAVVPRIGDAETNRSITVAAT